MLLLIVTQITHITITVTIILLIMITSIITIIMTTTIILAELLLTTITSTIAGPLQMHRRRGAAQLHVPRLLADLALQRRDLHVEACVAHALRQIDTTMYREPENHYHK